MGGQSVDKKTGPGLTLRFSKEEIARRVEELARSIDEKYGDEPLVMICVLKGAFAFFSDLARAISNPNLELDFTRLSSYGSSSQSSGVVSLAGRAEAGLEGKHVLIVEDIVDSGRSMDFMKGMVEAEKPLSAAIAAIVDKRERRERAVRVDFPGFIVDSGFLVGYGMDYAEKYRALPDIYEIEIK